jgi:hypothetical protein
VIESSVAPHQIPLAWRLIKSRQCDDISPISTALADETKTMFAIDTKQKAKSEKPKYADE